MLTLALVLAQLGGGVAPTASPRDRPTYATPALEAFVAAAARANAAPPASLRRYRARVESELALIIRDTIGREHVAQVEQIALDAVWSRDSVYSMRMVGYRSQTVGVPYSALSFARAWSVPHLYGQRLTLGIESGPTDAPAADQRHAWSDRRAKGERARTRPSREIRVVHPLADDRDRYYTYRGGDTVATLRPHGRVIRIVRVFISPRPEALVREESGPRRGGFDGEMDLDADRHEIVRLRGRFVTAQRDRGRRLSLSRMLGVTAAAYAELVNAEIGAGFWLPAMQRSELQGTVALFGASRSVFRITSRFSNFVIGTDPFAAALVTPDSTASAAMSPAASARKESDSASEASGSRMPIRTREPLRLSYAPSDSISAFTDWTAPIGASTAEVSADDFDDLAPPAWSPSGRPQFSFAPATLDEVFRFNRVEGLYLGGALGARPGDAAPGLSARVSGGWAFQEKTPRGGIVLVWARGPLRTSARTERALASTNDFTAPLDGGGGLGTLFGGPDDYDYVDRRTAAVGGSVTIVGGLARISAEVGAGEDRAEVARLKSGPLFGSAPYRPNRYVRAGTYAVGRAIVELNPGVTGVFLDQGVGGSISIETGSGGLQWTRAEATMSGRVSRGDFGIASRLMGGVVTGGSLPPQQLFELGRENSLSAYDYKAFAGDRAASGGALLSYSIPIWRRPRRLVREIMVPGIGPGVAVGILGGWSELTNPRVVALADTLAARGAGPCESSRCSVPIGTATNGVRASLDLRLTLFAGFLGVGVARPIDHPGRWRLIARVGQGF